MFNNWLLAKGHAHSEDGEIHKGDRHLRTERTVWWQDPLVHFVVLGVILFLVIKPTQEYPVTKELVIPAGLREDIAQQFETQFSRQPTQDETQSLLDEWLDSELLYRRGLEMNLDKKDPAVRERIIKRTQSIFEKSAAMVEPSREQLQAYYQENINNYLPPQRIDFEQVYIKHTDNAKSLAEELLSGLREGDDPSTLGYRYNNFKKRNSVAMAARFGDEFVVQLNRSEKDQWQLLHARSGWHLVRVHATHGGEAPSLDEVEHLVRIDWQKYQEQLALGTLIGELRSQYSVIDESSLR